MDEEAEVKELNETYRKKYGEKVEAVIAETIEAIRQTCDGDSLFFFHKQLITALSITSEMIKGSVIVSRDDLQENLN